MTSTNDIYQQVTDRIIAALEAGVTPWLKPWADSKAGAIGPHNAVTGRQYNGINWLILGSMPYASGAWLKFKQAKELGGTVRKGEKGTQIVFWSFPKIRDEETGKDKVVPFAKGYTVFHAEQCEGLNLDKIKHPAPIVAGETPINTIAVKSGAVVNHGGSRAFYNSGTDSIGMPSAASFQSADHYASTLAHELVHWTGHKSRCDRQFGKRFGDDAYAFEELVAEIGSAFVCAQAGIPLDGLQHDSYVASWLRVLKDDKRAIFTASSAAKKAAEMLLAEAQEEEAQEAA